VIGASSFDVRVRVPDPRRQENKSTHQMYTYVSCLCQRFSHRSYKDKRAFVFAIEPPTTQNDFQHGRSSHPCWWFHQHRHGQGSDWRPESAIKGSSLHLSRQWSMIAPERARVSSHRTNWLTFLISHAHSTSFRLSVLLDRLVGKLSSSRP
jgi:hypothetical protein